MLKDFPSGNGSVAKKIALFQISPPSAETSTRLRRKDAIKRKKCPPSSVSSSNLSSDSDNLSSPASSDCYGTRETDEYQDSSHSLIYDDVTSGFKGRTLLRTRDAPRRTLKDCYQSFSLPLVPGSRNLQLVEFTEIGLDSEDDLDDPEEEPFYEELDLYSKKSEDVCKDEYNGSTCSASALSSSPTMPDSKKGMKGITTFNNFMVFSILTK